MDSPYYICVTVEEQEPPGAGFRAGVAPEFAARLRVSADPLAEIETLFTSLRQVLLNAAGFGES